MWPRCSIETANSNTTTQPTHLCLPHQNLCNLPNKQQALKKHIECVPHSGFWLCPVGDWTLQYTKLIQHFIDINIFKILLSILIFSKRILLIFILALALANFMLLAIPKIALPHTQNKNVSRLLQAYHSIPFQIWIKFNSGMVLWWFSDVPEMSPSPKFLSVVRCLAHAGKKAWCGLVRLTRF